MSQKKKQMREQFRNDVFKRDMLTCRVCGKKREPEELDAHHITNRNDIENGGYIKANGITVCKDECHMKVELYHITGGKEWNEGLHPNDLYRMIGSHLKV